jgi:hypothetical protein
VSVIDVVLSGAAMVAILSGAWYRRRLISQQVASPLSRAKEARRVVLIYVGVAIFVISTIAYVLFAPV